MSTSLRYFDTASAGHEHAGANPNYDGRPRFRLNLQWHNHVLRSAIHLDAPHVNWPVGNRVGSAERFVNPNRVEMYHVNFGWQVIAPDAIVKTPPRVTSAVAALRGSPTLELMRRARRARR